MEGIIDYEALVSTTKIEDITPNKKNQAILRRLKNNDANFDSLCICSGGGYYDYIPTSTEDIGWLGYFIGQSTTLKRFWLHDNAVMDFVNSYSFYQGLNNNKSIQVMNFFELDAFEEGHMFARMEKFFKENHSLIEVHVDSCILGVEGARQLSNLLQYLSPICVDSISMKIVLTMKHLSI